MSDKQQSAVQYLEEQLKKVLIDNQIQQTEYLFDQAKELFKQQIIDSYNNCIKDRYNNALVDIGFKEKSEKCYNTGLEYFNQTFKTESNGDKDI